jgi:thiamine phosphate synthase YjbQ (UPF0047 family)
MSTRPISLSLEIEPASRFDVTDVSSRVRSVVGDVLGRYPEAMYASLHTTAGYLDPTLAVRLGNDPDRVVPFMRAFAELFPADAGYRHDQMELRDELSEAERAVEPRNADAHLAFIGAGLQTCVTYPNRFDMPVFFMDLDGEYEGRRRRRRTTVIAYSKESLVDTVDWEVSVSRHAIDSINLADPALGLDERIDDLVRRHGVEFGRVDLRLAGDEESAAVTVNEYETLLMRYDLAEVLQDPLRFMAHRGRSALRDPRAVPTKTLDYAKYDVVRLMNRLIESLGLDDTFLERLVTRVMAVPARRRLRFKRSLAMPVVSSPDADTGVVRGRYQSPILIQWEATPRRSRRLTISLSRFE